MTDSKAWYESKAVWGAVIAILASILHLGGYELGLLEQGQLVDGVVSLVGSVGALVALYGRIVASHALRAPKGQTTEM
ncbi:hypothetical protein [Rhizobium oryziradicis]|uniref:Uncharacterized protein n=1 Tax=Rhizobium oryziradicis TaxID=1867956 RepID=A0A1Q8ZXP8_9HYPH|nr:hypothetical protein [Rhizobium oryziradicis]OLP46857.1 hypothetical protein BJF95_14305 [Rhizobium oryziradicis]